MHCTVLGLIAASLLITAAPSASAQDFGDFEGGFSQPLPSAPSVHLLLGRQRPARQFVLWSFASYLSRNGDQLKRIYAMPQQSHSRGTHRNGDQPERFFALPQFTHTGRTHRRHRRQH